MPRTPSFRPLLYCAGALLSSLIALLLVRPGQAAGDRAGVTVTFGANTQLIGDPSLPNSIQENESSLAASPTYYVLAGSGAGTRMPLSSR